MANEVIVRFNKVSFEYGKKQILDEADFSVRRGSKITLMGQNGAGKSTIFQLISGDLKPHSGSIALANGLSIATSKQIIPREQMTLTVQEFFKKAFDKPASAKASARRGKIYDIEPRIEKVLETLLMYSINIGPVTPARLQASKILP